MYSALIGALTVAALLVAGCQSDSGSGANGAGSADDGPAADSTLDDGAVQDEGAAADSDPVQDGGVLGDAPPLFDLTVADAEVQPPDEPHGCGASGHYAERADDTNNPYAGGSAEPTGLTLSPGQVRLIGGCVTPSLGGEVSGDEDMYRFDVAGAMRLQASLIWDEMPPSLQAMAILTDDQTPLAWWTVSNSATAMTVPVDVTEGTYLLQLTSGSPAPSDARAYVIRLAEPIAEPCEPLTGLPDYVEADESADDHRGNDVAHVDWPLGGVTATEADDEPAPTGLTLAAGQNALIRGEAADVGTAGDRYLDRDTYAVASGPQTRLIELRLAHADVDQHLDLFVFDAGSTSRVLGAGTSIAFEPDAAVFAVSPGQTYWIWVGAADDRELGGAAALPLSYDLTVCAR